MKRYATDVEFASMAASGNCWMSTGTQLVHANGRVQLWTNGYRLDDYPSNDVLCRGDAVNRLRDIWTWALTRLGK